jgi:hypothetical protein
MLCDWPKAFSNRIITEKSTTCAHLQLAITPFEALGDATNGLLSLVVPYADMRFAVPVEQIRMAEQITAVLDAFIVDTFYEYAACRPLCTPSPTVERDDGVVCPRWRIRDLGIGVLRAREGVDAAVRVEPANMCPEVFDVRLFIRCITLIINLSK